MSLENTKEVLVLDWFLTKKENSVKRIATEFGLTEHRVHQIINKYLDNKV